MDAAYNRPEIAEYLRQHGAKKWKRVLGRTVPVVIHADEDAEDVRLEIDRVLLPTLFQVGDLVAADSPVDEGQVKVREGGAVLGGDDEHVTVAQDVIRILTATTVAVRERIALEQDARAGLEDADWFDGAKQRGGSRGDEEGG